MHVLQGVLCNFLYSCLTIIFLHSLRLIASRTGLPSCSQSQGSYTSSAYGLQKFITALKELGCYAVLNYPFKAYWLRDAPTVQHSTTVRSAPHCIYVFCIYLRTNYSINWLVFITEMKSVYSAVRTGSLN